MITLSELILNYLSNVQKDDLEGIWKKLNMLDDQYYPKHIVFNVLDLLLISKKIQLDSKGNFMLPNPIQINNFRHAIKIVNSYMLNGWSIELCEKNETFGNMYGLFDGEGKQQPEVYGSMLSVVSTAYIWHMYKNHNNEKIMSIEIEDYNLLTEALIGY